MIKENNTSINNTSIKEEIIKEEKFIPLFDYDWINEE